MKTHFSHQTGDGLVDVTVEDVGDGHYQVQVGNQSLALDVRRVGSGEYHALDGHRAHDALVLAGAPGKPSLVHLNGVSVQVKLLDERQAARVAFSTGVRAGARGGNGAIAIRAPMPGRVVKRLVQTGEAVGAGQGVIVIEAMKMENELRSPVEGSVKEVRVGEGDNVEAGEALVLVE